MILTFKNNSKLSSAYSISRSVIFVLVLITLFSTGGDILTVTNAKEMNRAKHKAVAPSNWGGSGIKLIVKKEGVIIQYDCAEAEINEKLMIDKKGNFSVEGTYLRHSPGAIRLKFKPKKQTAKFKGKISGEQMTLQVILTESDEAIGDYTLQKDETAKLHRCL